VSAGSPPPLATSHREARLPRFAMERRITVFVLIVSAVVVGTVATLGIPIELVPRGYSSPFLRILVPWRDAPPREVLEKITEPLEAELGTVSGIDRITSVSRTGSARCYLRFKQNTDMDLAYREVRDRIERARREFPEDVDRVYVFKDDVSGIPVYALGVAVPESITDTYNLLQKRIVLPIERLDGVASVEVQGLEEKEILIELDRDRTEACGLNIYTLGQQLGLDSFTMASGFVRDGARKLLLRSVARYQNLDELANRPLTPSVRLKDVAELRYDEPDKNYRVRANSKPAYAVIVFKEGQANAQAVSERIRETVEGFAEDPHLRATEMITFFSQGEMIEESLKTLLKSGLIGGIIAACVLFFFLRRLRVTAIVTSAIPLSLLIALTVMFFAGETLNILTLLALMVSVGLLVDNSVVVAENIDRLYKDGRSRRESAIEGAGEIALAITMSTLTTVIVFLPVALVEGPGQFFLMRMAIPISVALVGSLLVALVYIPLGVSLVLPPRATAAYARLTRVLGRGYDATFLRLNHAYNRLLAISLGRRLDLVIALAALFAVTGAVTSKRIEFVDTQENERSSFEIDVEMPEATSLEETESWFLKAEKVIEEHAEELGLDGWFLFHRKRYGELMGWYARESSVKLKHREVVERVLELLPRMPGMELTTGLESETEEERGESVYRVTLNGENPALIDEVAEELEEVFRRVEGVLGVRQGEQTAPNELALTVDRERAQGYGVNPRVVAGLVGYALRGQALPKYHDEGREIPVRVRFREEDRESLEDLVSFFVPTEEGGVLPLSAVVETRLLESPEVIVRRDKRISRTITLDLKEGSEKEARERLSTLTRHIDLPEGISFSGDTARQSLDEDLAGIWFALALSVLFIYLLMGLLFESFVLPLSIIFTIPLASLGVLWIHILLGLDIDFLGAVGLVLLVGVVVNNGIVLIDYVNRLRAGGLPRREAILQAANLRFRPIMMTAITTVGGMVPLALSGRMDSGISYTSFSLTLIGGMITATLLTLLVVPVFYTFFDDLRVTIHGALQGVLVRRARNGGLRELELGENRPER
jgi:HAE1 family hydrophobic/amphiphilic exporter-1